MSDERLGPLYHGRVVDGSEGPRGEVAEYDAAYFWRRNLDPDDGARVALSSRLTNKNHAAERVDRSARVGGGRPARSTKKKNAGCFGRERAAPSFFFNDQAPPSTGAPRFASMRRTMRCLPSATTSRTRTCVPTHSIDSHFVLSSSLRYVSSDRFGRSIVQKIRDRSTVWLSRTLAIVRSSLVDPSRTALKHGT